MFKKISTIAVAGALMAGAIATPVFAKGGYNNKYSISTNRSIGLLVRGFRHPTGGFKIVGVMGVKERVLFPNSFDTLILYNKLTNVSGN
jgi:hypothetical protein